MTRGWIVGGWLVALTASLLPVIQATQRLAERNPLRAYVDPASGAYTAQLYWQFARWWLPIAVPVSLLALACMFLNRER